MELTRKTISAICLVLSLCSCATPTLNREIDRGGVDVLLVREGERAAYFKPSGSTEVVCAPRESDFGLAVNDGISLSLPTVLGSESVSANAGQSATALGGRSSLALLTRELMFRACELTLNINANADETRAVYTEFIQALVEISSHTAISSQGSEATQSQDSSSSNNGESQFLGN